MSDQKQSKRQTDEQKRSAQAWSDVKSVDGKNIANAYRDLARKTPAMIQMNGLGQALAFLRAKAGQKRDNEHWLIYHHLSAWVLKAMQIEKEQPDHLLEWVVEQDSAVYRRATTESMAYLAWLKRWAEALLPEK